MDEPFVGVLRIVDRRITEPTLALYSLFKGLTIRAFNEVIIIEGGGLIPWGIGFGVSAKKEVDDEYGRPADENGESPEKPALWAIGGCIPPNPNAH